MRAKTMIIIGIRNLTINLDILLSFGLISLCFVLNTLINYLTV